MLEWWFKINFLKLGPLSETEDITFKRCIKRPQKMSSEHFSDKPWTCAVLSPEDSRRFPAWDGKVFPGIFGDGVPGDQLIIFVFFSSKQILNVSIF